MKRIIYIIVLLIAFFIFVGCDNQENDKKNINMNKNNEYLSEYLVIKDKSNIYGKDAMDEFYERTQNGEKLKLTLINKLDKYIKTYYIEYDGEYYKTNMKLYTNSPNESTFKYLVYSEVNEVKGINERQEQYCLSNNEKHTYETVFTSWLSAVSYLHINDAIPFYNYCYYICGFKNGIYVYRDNTSTGSKPTLSFYDGREYSLSLSTHSSTVIYNNFQIEDGYIYLITNKVTESLEKEDGRIALKINENSLTVDLSKSTTKNILEDGMEFKYIEYDEVEILNKIKNDYYNEYLKNDNQYTVNDVYIQRYYGCFSNSYVIMLNYKGGGKGLNTLTTIDVGGVSLTFPTTSDLKVWNNGKFYSLLEAYTNGFITTQDLEYVKNSIENEE